MCSQADEGSRMENQFHNILDQLSKVAPHPCDQLVVWPTPTEQCVWEVFARRRIELKDRRVTTPRVYKGLCLTIEYMNDGRADQPRLRVPSASQFRGIVAKLREELTRDGNRTDKSGGVR